MKLSHRRSDCPPVWTALLRTVQRRARELGDPRSGHWTSLRCLHVLFLLVLSTATWATGEARMPRLIAHAGGAVEGATYSNSLQALNSNYQLGHRWFELDFSFTSDRHLVLIHDWDKTYARLFQGEAGAVPTREEFMHRTMINGWQQLDLPGLLAWMREHPDALVITDVKDDNLAALEQIAHAAPELRDRFVPQIYWRTEWARARELGYRRLIYTLYRSPDTPEEVAAFVSEVAIFAVVSHASRKGHDRLLELLLAAGVAVYLHTHNDAAEVDALLARGVAGVYTDFLVP